ncbi:MAG: hypothetical protein GXD23_15120 [Comamonadaceae bacterium]|jgi:hypothetical protein|uniref:DUF5983 family protein n=1 Tax=Hydrogenophaga sp. PML113 TaxID=1899350 RepID=UPI0008788489|nr:hypothetical protein [Hydrogenophaga sp. PML113]NCT98696.1 hypothetical protein [Comamonadaceae bacterium]
MEIHQMLCLSTAHLTQITREQLENDDLEGAIYHPKSMHGWFLYVPEPALKDLLSNLALPQDVRDCLSFASERDIQWLMFDADGPVVHELALYEESELTTAL